MENLQYRGYASLTRTTDKQQTIIHVQRTCNLEQVTFRLSFLKKKKQVKIELQIRCCKEATNTNLNDSLDWCDGVSSVLHG